MKKHKGVSPCIFCGKSFTMKGMFACYKCRKPKRTLARPKMEQVREIPRRLHYDGTWDNITRAYEGD